QGESSAAPMISLWYEWVNAKGERVSDLRWINVGALGAGSRREGNQLLDFATLDSERGKITLGEFAMAAPSSATHLKLAIDGPNAHAESNEQNNAVLLPKPVFPKPDLAFTDVFIVPNTGKLLIGFQNMGKVAAPEFPWTMAWVDAAGKRLGVSYEGIGLALKPSWRFGISNDDRDLKGKPMTIGKWLVQPKPDGATTLEIVIDPENRIVESDEGNNRRTFDRWSPPEPVKPKFADFRVAEFTIDPVAPRAGERVWFTARVENVGSATTGTPTAAGILVDNDVASRKLVGQFTTAIIPAGKSVMVRWTKENYYGWVAVEGTHTIDVCADRAAVVAEADEANNCTRKTITVPAREAPKAADLIVGSVEVRDGALRIVVRNTGDLFTFPTDIWLMWFGAKGALPSSGAVDLPAIAGGAEAVVTVPFDGKTEASRILRDPPKDATKLRVYADGSRKIEEANEDNNDALLDRAKLPAAPVGNKPPTADAGSDIVERDDDGDGKEDTRFYSRESKDPDGKIVSWVWTVAGREVATGQYPYWWKVPVGTHRVTLTVTDDGGLTATDTVTVTVTGKPAVPPDLVLETLTLDPAAPKPGDDVSFTARVANRGPIAVGQVHTLALDIDLKNDRSINVQLAQPVIKDLPAGESQTYQWKKDPYSTYYHWRAEEGTHRVVVCADKSNSIRESDEKNNCAEVVVTVAAAPPAKPATPDLVVEQVFVLPSKPTANVRVEFATVIRNAGKAAAEESIAYVVLDLGADGEPDATPEPIDVPALKAGESRAVTWPDAEVLPAGKHMIEVCADVGEDVDEAEEENNCKELTFTVDAPARTSLLLLPLRLVLDVFSTPIRAGAAE
ncbi:MAG: CARDB domain-containing protein, partial [bacterium]|nr:CARDB domain-containing protein [bacterium]